MHFLERQQIFSRSLLWELQRRYFDERGVDAWRQGEVPHYVTDNVTMARSYAEIVLALWRDQQRLAPDDTPGDEPLYLCELGAGSGRFAFHFLHQLTALCTQAHIAPTAFRYILTDFTASNLAFWRQHPRFQPFFADGVLDVALFDVTRSDQLSLQVSGKTLSTACLHRPLVVIANYVFDSIPQDLYYIDKQQCYLCLVSLLVDEDPTTLTTAEVLACLHLRYAYQLLSASPYQEPYLQQLLADYQRTLTATHLFFPAMGLRCLHRLRALSTCGLLALSADKGDHRLSALQGKGAPSLVHHGSFSLTVNYHAFIAYCEQQGGVALFPECRPEHLNIGCLMLIEHADAYQETCAAYQGVIQECGPDEWYTISKHARQQSAEMTLAQIMAYTRLSHDDSHFFAHYLPRLLELADACDDDERESISKTVERVWAGYFPLGEKFDLAYQLACLLYALDDYAGALRYFECSIACYGSYTGILYNMAVCHQLLGHDVQALSLLRTVVQYEPTNQQAQRLLTTISTT